MTVCKAVKDKKCLDSDMDDAAAAEGTAAEKPPGPADILYPDTEALKRSI